MSYLTDFSKNEIVQLKSEITSLKSKLLQRLSDLDVVKRAPVATIEDLKSKLSPDGKAVLSKLLEAPLQFNENKFIKEYNENNKNDIEEKFSREKMRRLR